MNIEMYKTFSGLPETQVTGLLSIRRGGSAKLQTIKALKRKGLIVVHGRDGYAVPQDVEVALSEWLEDWGDVPRTTSLYPYIVTSTRQPSIEIIVFASGILKARRLAWASKGFRSANVDYYEVSANRIWWRPHVFKAGQRELLAKSIPHEGDLNLIACTICREWENRLGDQPYADNLLVCETCLARTSEAPQAGTEVQA